MLGAILSIPRDVVDGFLRPRALVSRLKRGVYGQSRRHRALSLGLFYFANLLVFSLPIVIGSDGVYAPGLEYDAPVMKLDYLLQEVVIAAADIIVYSGWALATYHFVLWVAGRSRGVYTSLVVFARTTAVYLFSLFTLSTLLYGGAGTTGARQFIGALAKSVLLFGVELYVELTDTSILWGTPRFGGGPGSGGVPGIPNSVALNEYRLGGVTADKFQYGDVLLTFERDATISPDGSVFTHSIGTEQVAAFAELQQPVFSPVGALLLAAFLVVLLYFSYSLYLSARLYNDTTRGEAAIAASTVFVVPLVFLPVGTLISVLASGMSPLNQGFFQKLMLFAPLLLVIVARPFGAAVDHLRVTHD